MSEPVNPQHISDIEMIRLRMIMNLLDTIQQVHTDENVINQLFQSEESRDKPTCEQFLKDLQEITITDEEESCSICLEELKPGDKIIKLPCKDKPHYFHSGCNKEECEGILPWFKSNHTCPVCRTEFPIKEQEQEQVQVQEQVDIGSMNIMNIFIQPLMNHNVVPHEEDSEEDCDLQQAIYESLRSSSQD